ncbi:transmembrane protein 232 isoform X2 [Arapaima gigas]
MKTEDFSLEVVVDDSLDCLLVSLDQAPVCAEQVPVLFHLAECVLYQICTDTSHKPDLYPSEFKMLKVGYLVFFRLFICHILGNLKEHQMYKPQLLEFLKALAQYETYYEPYPDLLFYVHFMLRSGEIICAFGSTDKDSELFHTDSHKYVMKDVLWYSLLSWYCVQNNIKQLFQVLKDLVHLRDDLRQDDWVDSGLGMMVLGEAAKRSLQCLQVLQMLSGYSRPEANKSQPDKERHWPWQLEIIYTNVLSDICQHGCSAEIQKTALVGGQTLFGQDTSGDEFREGLRNTAWMALQEHLAREVDPQPPADVVPHLSVSWRLACALAQLYFTPLLAHLHPSGKRSRKSPVCPKHRLEKHRPSVLMARRTPPKQGAHGTSRLQSGLFSRTESDFMKVVRDQWHKELQVKMTKEEETEKKKLELKEMDEEERFKEVMRKRMEKLKIATKPYELPYRDHRSLFSSAISVQNRQ